MPKRKIFRPDDQFSASLFQPQRGSVNREGLINTIRAGFGKIPLSGKFLGNEFRLSFSLLKGNQNFTQTAFQISNRIMNVFAFAEKGNIAQHIDPRNLTLVHLHQKTDAHRKNSCNYHYEEDRPFTLSLFYSLF